MPVYNASAYLEKTVETVRRQTCTSWEPIAVDDCSTDDSFQVLQRLAGEDARIRPVRQEGNQGAAAARNRGVALAEGRYLAYLDADDLWTKTKLEKELAFLKEKQAAFAFTGYEFGDSEGVGNGKVVHVPETLTYKKALSRTVIFTTTVLFDLEKISKDLVSMPRVKSLDENLAVYRRPASSLSSNKLEAIRRIWHLYRKQEKLSLPVSAWHFCFWAWRAVARRV